MAATRRLRGHPLLLDRTMKRRLRQTPHRIELDSRGSVHSPHQTCNIGDMTMTTRIKNKKSASGCHLETLTAEMETRQTMRIHYTSSASGVNHG
jgi:hypothetical protein